MPDAKIICMVRNVAWVTDSIERLIRKNPLLPSRLYADDDERATVYSRCDAIGHRNRLVGGVWSALKDRRVAGDGVDGDERPLESQTFEQDWGWR